LALIWSHGLCDAFEMPEATVVKWIRCKYIALVGELKAADPLSGDRQRRPGAGRRAREVEQPELIGVLESLLEPVARGR